MELVNDSTYPTTFEPNLERCPCCGEVASLESHLPQFDDEKYFGQEAIEHFIQCIECQLRTPSRFSPVIEWKEGDGDVDRLPLWACPDSIQKQLADIWNNREQQFRDRPALKTA